MLLLIRCVFAVARQLDGRPLPNAEEHSSNLVSSFIFSRFLVTRADGLSFSVLVLVQLYQSISITVMFIHKADYLCRRKPHLSTLYNLTMIIKTKTTPRNVETLHSVVSMVQNYTQYFQLMNAIT